MIHGLAAVVSGLLLFAAFPPLELSWIAWIALVPLLLIVVHASPVQALRMGLITGLVFWWLSIAWMTHVSWFGWFLLGGYCALYIAGFSLIASWMLRRSGMRCSGGMLGALFGIPALWVGFEYLRSMLFTGFPWNPMGVSQAINLSLIQWAEWGGVYVVSFLVVLVNTALALTLLQSGRLPRIPWYRLVLPLSLALTILLLCRVQGMRTIRQVNGRSGLPLRVAVIQLNIPQFEKWAAEYGAAIEARLQRITTAAIQRYHPELVVWPETAIPSFIRDSVSTQKLISGLLIHGIPLLVGAMDFETTGDTIRYYNNSFLFDPERGLTQIYAKRHLVAFGEYIPMESLMPFVRSLTPVEESFTPGKIPTVFRLDASPRAFSVLICFEDTVAYLARDAVRAGARLLINQTNDAWFDPSCASRQHMLHGVFRCVENRVPGARSTNTGITCFIDRTGMATGLLAPGREPLPEPECVARTVLLPGPEMPLTFYTKYGDLFAQVCMISLILPLAIAAMGTMRKSRPRMNSCN